jgi:GT2 family glycosyltransferase
MNIAVVILNWNGKSYLEQFLPGVLQYSKDVATVYVADNASTDDSVDYVQQHFPDVKVVVNESNGGFAKGYNDALKRIEADYYVLLNSDIEVTPNWITPVIDLMQTDESITACQPKILAHGRKEYFEHAGAAGGFIDKNGFPFCRGRIFNTVEKDEAQYNDTTEVFWATGACLFIKANVYHKFDGLDEDFFAHMEEIDLCWRMKNAGHKIMYCPDAVVYHVGGGTLNYMSPQKTYLNFRNNLFLIYKNYQQSSLFLKIMKRLIIDGIAGAKFFFGGQFKHTWAVIKAHFHFYGKLGSMRKKRKALLAKNNTPNNNGLYKGSIISDHFLKGKKEYHLLDEDRFVK